MGIAQGVMGVYRRGTGYGLKVMATGGGGYLQPVTSKLHLEG